MPKYPERRPERRPKRRREASEASTNTRYPRQTKDPEGERSEGAGGARPWAHTRRHPPKRNATHPQPTTPKAPQRQSPQSATPAPERSDLFRRRGHSFNGRGQSHRARPPATARPHTPPTLKARRPRQHDPTKNPTAQTLRSPTNSLEMEASS